MIITSLITFHMTKRLNVAFDVQKPNPIWYYKLKEIIILSVRFIQVTQVDLNPVVKQIAWYSRMSRKNLTLPCFSLFFFLTIYKNPIILHLLNRTQKKNQKKPAKLRTYTNNITQFYNKIIARIQSRYFSGLPDVRNPQVSGSSLILDGFE